MLGLNWKSKPPDSSIRRVKWILLNPAMNCTYQSVSIEMKNIFIRGVASLDVLLIVNLEYLYKKIYLLSFCIIAGLTKIIRISTSCSFIFHQQYFQISSYGILTRLSTLLKLFTDAG